MRQCHEPLSEEAINEFETWLGERLPEKYRQFLLRNNGGLPSKNMANGCYVQNFNPLSQANEYGSLRSDTECFREDLPPGVIPIAHPGTGSRICISLTDGKIYLWDRDEEYEAEQATLGELQLLAEDIDDLLDQLDKGSEDEEGGASPDDEMIGNIGRWGNLSRLEEYLREGNDINKTTASGGTIAQSAVYAGNLQFLQECVRLGADLHGKRLLHAAAFKMDQVLADYLLSKGVDPNELDEKQRTPLGMVIIFSNSGQLPAWAPIAEYLRQHGGRIKA